MNKNNFNLLRFIFASLVIVSHVPELQDGNRSHEILTRLFGTISFGEMAVDSFFVLSGFLIVKSWIDRPRFLSFITSRVLRIYPGFIVAAMLCAFIVGPFYGVPGYFQQFDLLRFSYGVAKLSLAGIPSVFPDTPYPLLNGSMWSIPYEFKCYLLVLVLGLFGVINRLWLWGLIFLFFSLGHVVSFFEPLLIRFDLYFRCGMAFTAGGGFYLFRNIIPWKESVAWGALVLFFIFIFIKPFAELALCLFWGYAILYYAMSGTSFLWFNRLPDISYGIYLYAWPINKMLLWHFPEINVYIAMVIVFVLAIFSGVISLYLVERPFLHLKNKFRHKNLVESS